MEDPALTAADQPIFYYDLGSPLCYLAAEQVMHALPVVAEWQPVLADALRTSGPETLQPSGSAVIDREWIEQAAADLGLQAIRWPERLPADSGLAMLAATYAKEIGRGVSFSLAAFRQAFAGGHDLSSRDTVLIAGAACEMHPTALMKALDRPAVARGLERAGARARAAGVPALPALQAAGQVFSGEDFLERAGAALHAQGVRPDLRPA